MKTGKTAAAFAIAALSAFAANATYYTATASGECSLSTLEWAPKKPASFAAGDTLRIVSGGGGVAP